MVPNPVPLFEARSTLRPKSLVCHIMSASLVLKKIWDSRRTDLSVYTVQTVVNSKKDTFVRSRFYTQCGPNLSRMKMASFLNFGIAGVLW